MNGFPFTSHLVNPFVWDLIYSLYNWIPYIMKNQIDVVADLPLMTGRNLFFNRTNLSSCIQSITSFPSLSAIQLLHQNTGNHLLLQIANYPFELTSFHDIELNTFYLYSLFYQRIAECRLVSLLLIIFRYLYPFCHKNRVVFLERWAIPVILLY